MSSNFAIVNLRDGSRRDLTPFLLSNDAFPLLENAYLFRGRIQRRSCTSKLGTGTSRLRWQIGTTGASPFTFTLPDNPISSAISQFSIGSVFFTDPGGASPINLLSTNGAYTGTLNRGNGLVTLNHPAIAATSVYYYPGLPVTGLRTREQPDINFEITVGFDTKYSYFFSNSTGDFEAANTYKVTNTVFTWSGSSSDLFWTTNYLGAFWTTNNINGFHAQGNITGISNAASAIITFAVAPNFSLNDFVFISGVQGMTQINGLVGQVTGVGAFTITVNINSVAFGVWASGGIVQNLTDSISGDGIKWFDGPGVNKGWVNFSPPLDPVSNTSIRYLKGALIILPYKDRLVCLNTYESTDLTTAVNFKQRARWSQNGTPYYTNNSTLLPTNQTAQANAWDDITPGKGGFIDAPTNEEIISAEFIKDTLIVYFERSTWQLIYTGNETLPFFWQKINTELGTESTFSIIPFDRGVFGIGNYGVITCDSVNVQRIDQKIPDEVFQIQNINDGVKRVYGIRDYTSQLVYWTFPIVSDNDNKSVNYTLTFPNQLLVFNYLDGSWSEFDDCFTCFGYWQSVSGKTWQSQHIVWDSANFVWNSGTTQGRYPDVIAGNQRGFVFVFSQLQGLGQNVPSLEISNFNVATITCPDHNLRNNEYVLITECTGFTASNDIIYKINVINKDSFSLIVPSGVNATGYTGNGKITHMPNLTITTKQFNPFYESGKSARVNYLDIYTDRTEEGEFIANFFTSSNNTVPVETQTVLTSPEPTASYSAQQQRIWHRIYTNSFGSFFQNTFTLNDAQMRDINIATSDITIHGLIYYVNPAGRISYDL